MPTEARRWWGGTLGGRGARVERVRAADDDDRRVDGEECRGAHAQCARHGGPDGRHEPPHARRRLRVRPREARRPRHRVLRAVPLGRLSKPTEQARQVVHDAGFDGLLRRHIQGNDGADDDRTRRCNDFWTGYYFGPAWAGWYGGYAVHRPTREVRNRRCGTLIAGDSFGMRHQLRTENPSTGREFVSSLVNAVVPSLTRAGVLPPEGLLRSACRGCVRRAGASRRTRE